jgi:hypothetical protein
MYDSVINENDMKHWARHFLSISCPQDPSTEFLSKNDCDNLEEYRGTSLDEANANAKGWFPDDLGEKRKLLSSLNKAESTVSRMFIKRLIRTKRLASVSPEHSIFSPYSCMRWSPNIQKLGFRLKNTLDWTFLSPEVLQSHGLQELNGHISPMIMNLFFRDGPVKTGKIKGEKPVLRHGGLLSPEVNNRRYDEGKSAPIVEFLRGDSVEYVQDSFHTLVFAVEKKELFDVTPAGSSKMFDNFSSIQNVESAFEFSRNVKLDDLKTDWKSFVSASWSHFLPMLLPD